MLERLSTYGLLPDGDPEGLRLLLKALVRTGCATLSDDGEDWMAITAKWIRVAKKEEPKASLVC